MGGGGSRRAELEELGLVSNALKKISHRFKPPIKKYVAKGAGGHRMAPLDVCLTYEGRGG